MSDPASKAEVMQLRTDFNTLAVTVDSNHKKANAHGAIAMKNQRRLDELVGQRGDGGIVADLEEVKRETKATRKFVEKQYRRERREGFVNLGGAAGGGGLVYLLVEIIRWLA